MSGKSVTLDFGIVFLSRPKDRDRVVRMIEQNVQNNVGQIIEDGALKHRMYGDETPLRLKVTVELAEA